MFEDGEDGRIPVVAVTGTNGKTTVTYMLESLLGRRGPVGVMGTVELRYGDVARAAAWLLDPINGWITGQVIYADGGASLMNAEVAPEIQLG